MRNTSKSKIAVIFEHLKGLPYFRLEDLSGLSADKNYLKTLFCRYVKRGKLVRLKKNLYATRDFLEEMRRQNALSSYTEFLANLLYPSSYLSLEYVLYHHQILTDVPVHLTCVTTRKTNHFTNALGTFFYHTLQKQLYCGFTLESKNNFTIARATRAKALFDYLYLRKNLLAASQEVKELRLNLGELNTKDRLELKKYIELEGSRRMRTIFKNLWR